MPVVPACFNYSDAADADLGKFSVIVAGRGSALGRAHYRERRLAGARIVQYIDIIDIGYIGGPFDERFCAGAPTIPGAPTNWGGLRIVDLSVSSWRDKLVEQMKWALSHEDVTDLFLDVFGERLWTSGGWGAMTSAQQAAFRDGTADLATIEDDLRKIRGSAGSSAGKAADRLRGVKGRASIALERLGDS